MMSECDIWWYATMRGWQVTFDFLHPGEYIRGVFLSRSEKDKPLFWGPLGAVQSLSTEAFLAHLDRLNDCEQPE